jgi:hypothetical protein
VSHPTARGYKFTDLRDLAVFLVDCRHGYTMEFAPSPAAHVQEYDDLADQLSRLRPGNYEAVGFDDDNYDTPFTLPRCESRHREDKRSWRCALTIEHPGQHSSGPGGGRRWR